MDYLATWRGVTDGAPSVRFLVRPLRRELLDEQNVLVDFAQRALDLPAGSVGDTGIWSNRGLPLEVVNELQGRRRSPLWKSIHDNSILTRIKPFVMALELEDSPRVLESRAWLRAFAHQRFEDSNRELAALCGWGTDHLIGPPEPGPRTVSLAELDAAWAPRAAPAVRKLLIHALAQIGANNPPVDS
jgi:hypothetical protein